eukprot:m.91747 g.91747  ORF g.91747 m.91747 type:complete len:79 (+) comp13318_c0_seq4:1633-1869(+)
MLDFVQNFTWIAVEWFVDDTYADRINVVLRISLSIPCANGRLYPPRIPYTKTRASSDGSTRGNYEKAGQQAADSFGRC